MATNEMIDADGYRANVGIILCNNASQVMWARRIGQDAWQFPQGGIGAEEDPRDAMYRELWEETGLKPGSVSVLGATDSWLRYKLPKRLMRRNTEPRCVGQKQMWYLLRLDSDEESFDLAASNTPEFDHWKWVDYWYPVDNVVFFKRRVYQCALAQLESSLPSADVSADD